MTQTLDSPFDSLAQDYDARFSTRLPAIWLRAAVRQRIADLIRPGLDVLELGCGTGEDAVWLAGKGCRVYATDASAAMLKLARQKTRAGESGGITFAPLDVRTDWQLRLPEGFRPGLVLANFGALNCVANPEAVLHRSYALLGEQGHVAVTLMGRFCLWETGYFLCRGRFRQAARRWNGRASYRVGEANHPVWYHRVAFMRSAAEAAGFDVDGVYGVGGLLPMSEAFHVCERWPRFFTTLARLDSRLAPWTAGISDHYLLLLRKGPA